MSRPKKKQKGVKRILGWGLKFFLKFLLILLVLTTVQVLLLRFINPPFTARVAGGWIKSKINSTVYNRPHYYWRKLNDISPHLKKAVLASEDQRFLSHLGFDLIEINQAVWDILRSKRVRGASTITMQVARTVFLWHGRSWLRKIAEAYYTILVEMFWNKARILEIYLNTVDWGKGIMGAEAASKKYFHTDSAHLTASQGALLAAILPSPHKWSPTHPNKLVRIRQKRILKDMTKMPNL